MSVLASRQDQFCPNGNLENSSKNENGNKKHFYTLAILTWMACVIPSTLLLISGPRPYGETIGYTPITQFVRTILLILMLGYAVLLILRFGSNLRHRPVGVFFLVILAVMYPLVSDFLKSQEIITAILPTFISLIIPVALFSLKIEYRDLKIFGLLGTLTGFLSLLMALFKPSSAYALEGGGRVLAGPFDNSNYLGIFLVLLLPFVLLFTKASNRLLGGLLIVWPIFISGSNTSVAAAALFVALGLFSRIVKNSRLVGIIALMVVQLLVLICVAIPFLVRSPEAFTGRGTIWILAQKDFANYWLFGASHEWFEVNSAGVGFRAAHAHNIFLHPLLLGGLGASTLIIFFIVYLVRHGYRKIQQGELVIILFMQVFVVGGMFEQIFLLDIRDLRYLATGFIIVSLLSLASSSTSLGRCALPQRVGAEIFKSSGTKVS